MLRSINRISICGRPSLVGFRPPKREATGHLTSSAMSTKQAGFSAPVTDGRGSRSDRRGWGGGVSSSRGNPGQGEGLERRPRERSEEGPTAAAIASLPAISAHYGAIHAGGATMRRSSLLSEARLIPQIVLFTLQHGKVTVCDSPYRSCETDCQADFSEL